MKEPIRKILWSAASQQASNSTITLNDSIDNYDEIIYYGSGTKNDRTPCVATEYPVIPGVLNLGGPFFVGKWASADSDNFILCNGTQVFLSGNSGYVASSFYMGKNNSSTAWAASLLTNRTNDVRPYRIVGVKYKNDSDRSLIWSSTGVNLYNQNIALSETINHFDKIIVYGSGYENTNVGCYKASKNSYAVQPNKLMNVGTWCYTPWKYAEKHNLLIGNEMLITGNSGHINSGFYWGMGNQTTGYVAAKVTADISSFAMPYAIIGVGRHPSYRFIDETTEGGSVSSNINPGYSGDIATLTVTPESEVWKMSALNITGAELTGNDFMFTNSNVTAQAEFEHSRDLTLENGDHGVLNADKMSGFSGDVVTVDATTDEGWYLSAIALTGAEATGFKFMFTGSDVTALGEYTDVGFPITYLSDEHVSLTGDQIYIPGQSGITLDSGYDTYYRISGYDIENGSINEEGLLIPTGPCTIKAVETPNYFTATGNFEKGSNVSKQKGSISVRKYALYVGHTGDIPTSWYATSNHWNPSNASSYSITLNSRMLLGANYSADTKANAITARACTIINGSYTNTAGKSYTDVGKSPRFTYSKNITTTTMSDYSISGYAAVPNTYHPGTAVYIATGTTGTWTATGIAP
jgi:hypothetical protein